MNIFFRSVNQSLLVLTLFLFTIIVAINESILLISSLYLLVSNLFFCAIFFLDKKRAKLDGQRVSEFSLCVLAMFFIYLKVGEWGSVIFGISLVLLLLSLVISAREIQLSTKALDLELSDMELGSKIKF